jgi:uncharacterized protein DUF2752
MAAEPGSPLTIAPSAAAPLPPAAPSTSPVDRLSSNQSTPLTRAARLALVALAFAAAVAFEVPLCPFAILTRHPCPGCGLTRGTLALLHGHLGEALRFHPLVPVVSPLVALVLGWNALSYVRRGRWSAAEGAQGRWITRAAAMLGALMIAVWVARFLGALGGPVSV